jgi:hypothetical protein
MARLVELTLSALEPENYETIWINPDAVLWVRACSKPRTTQLTMRDMNDKGGRNEIFVLGEPREVVSALRQFDR